MTTKTLKIKYLLSVVCTALIMNMAFPLPASVTQEYEIKAAFLYNFAKFVEWPEESFSGAETSFIIGILGQDPFKETINQINGKIVQNRTVVVKRFGSAADIGACHILFISPTEKSQLNEIMEAVKNGHVLTVSEVQSFTQSGGIVNFFIENNKIRFEINVDSANRSGLNISSKLLKLARVVE